MSDDDPDSQRLLDAKKILDMAISTFQQINAEEHGDTEPVVVLGWALVVASTSYAQYGEKRGTTYAWIAPEDQPWHHSAGLLRYATNSIEGRS